MVKTTSRTQIPVIPIIFQRDLINNPLTVDASPSGGPEELTCGLQADNAPLPGDPEESAFGGFGDPSDVFDVNDAKDIDQSL